MRRELIVLWMLPLVLSGCLSQSKIQTSYIRQRDDCRGSAEEAVMAKPEEHASQNATGYNLAKEFSDCMAKNGWHVASPKAPSPGSILPSPDNPIALGARPVAMQPASAQPAVVAPSAAVPAAASNVPAAKIPANNAAAASATAIPQQRVATPAASGAAPVAAPQIGPGVMPNPAPAEYQPAPARPSAVPNTHYGTGAGRQF